jgi:hypothetical protein
MRAPKRLNRFLMIQSFPINPDDFGLGILDFGFEFPNLMVQKLYKIYVKSI